MGIRFFSVPGHALVSPPRLLPSEPRLEPDLPATVGVVERALGGAEFRDQRAADRLSLLLGGEGTERYGAPQAGCGPSVVYAQPPRDLPALLRMADRLETLATREEGERAMVWRCESCGTRYAVPVGLVRNVAIRCERCGNPVQLNRDRSLGEEALMDPFHGAVNAARRQLATFFREAMARGWPVLACHSTPGPQPG